MALHSSDSSHSSSSESITEEEPFFPPDSGYRMMFVVNLEHYTTHGTIAKKVNYVFYLLLTVKFFQSKENLNINYRNPFVIQYITDLNIW
jgi:hypothetical protein